MTHATASFLRPADRLVGLFELFGRGVVGFETCAPVPESQLHPEEAACIRNAIEKRRQEFAGGRLCARRALATFEVADTPLLVGEDRFPRWPAEFVGSISHTRGYCGAVVARCADYAGIGVDVERRGRLKVKLERIICTEEERSWLGSLPTSQRGDMAMVLFCAKEAFYKCQYCVTAQWLGFRDATVRIEGDRFEVQLQKPLDGLRERRGPLLGRFALAKDHVFAGIGLAALR